MTIKLTIQEIKDRQGYIEPLKPTYLMCKKCGQISTFYVMSTGIMDCCFYCGQDNDYELVEVIDD